MNAKWPCTLISLMISLSGLSQITLWLENFENGCSASCATFTGVNGAWSFVNSPAAPAGLCGYAGANGGSSNRWYISCAENGMANGVCGTGCGADESLHMGSVTLGDIGAAYDAAQTTCKMAVSPAINTTAAGTNAKTVLFEHIRFGQGTTDCAQFLYSIDNGATWNYLANPIPVVTCCSGACSGQDQGVWVTVSFALPATCDNITTLRLGFNWKNNASGGSDPSFAVNNLRITYNAVLPVELLSFSGHQKGKHIELNWSTASEINSAYFEVERSVDGNVFEPVGKVHCKGNPHGITTYSVLDKNPLPGTVYYRLKQVDTDGSQFFSGMLPVKYSPDDDPLTLTCTFDSQHLIIHLKTDDERSIHIDVFDVTGKNVLDKQYHLVTGNNKVTLPASEFPASSYIVRVSDPHQAEFSYSVKAVKALK